MCCCKFGDLCASLTGFVQTVFLVGGLGSSEYLLEQLKVKNGDVTFTRCPDA